MISNEGEDITPLIDDFSIDIALAKLNHRQQNRLLRVMSGFLDGCFAEGSLQ